MALISTRMRSELGLAPRRARGAGQAAETTDDPGAGFLEGVLADSATRALAEVDTAHDDRAARPDEAAQPARSRLIDRRAELEDPSDAPENGESEGDPDDPSSDPAGAGGRRRWRGFFNRRKEANRLAGQFSTYPHLLALKPREKYVFRSDYYMVDGSFACVMAFFHDDASHDNFGAFWGINRVPDGLGPEVTVVVLEQVRRMDDKWIDNYIKQSEKLDRLDAGEQAETGTASSRRKAAKVSGDLQVVTAEVQDGASYLSVQNRLLVKAPTLESLDETIDRISRLYIDRFGTLKIAPYAGEQRSELSGLLGKNAKKRGKGFGFSSTELAGSYSLVTNGLNDPDGEYVGYMIGDVNNSAVLLNADGYAHHVVIADGGINDYLDRARIPDMWASKLSQACLLNNGSVVHLVLDGADLDQLGPTLDAITSRVDLNTGDVNPFEMFGDQADELSIFSAQMQKLTLLFEQLYQASDGGVASIIRNSLESTATQFYVDQGMWFLNAQEQRQRLRVVNVPHRQVPRLQMFSAYLDTAHKALLNSSKTDPDTLRAYNVLSGVAKNLLDNNGDLFNNHTSDAIDGVRDARRVIYDFSRLQQRGQGVAMAQLVNIISFAVGKLGRGDTVIIHGTESIDDRVKGYIDTQFAHLYHRGGRAVFCYNDVDKMLDDAEFNKFDAADYLVFGSMRDKAVATYQELLHQQIPVDLAKQITRREAGITYLRRGVSNVVFHMDLALGVDPRREAKRRSLRLEAAEQARAAQQLAVSQTPASNTTGPVKQTRPSASGVRRGAASRKRIRRTSVTPPVPTQGPRTLPRHTPDTSTSTQMKEQH